MDHIVALCAQCALIPHSASPGYPPSPHGQFPCPLAVGCISNTPSQPVVSGSGSASSSCFCFSVCFHLPKCVFFCAPSVSYINTSALCSCFSVFCFLSSPVQCSSVPWYPLGCYPGYLAVPLVCFGSYLAVPTQGGGIQRGSSPACWRHCFARFQAVIARIVAL